MHLIDQRFWILRPGHHIVKYAIQNRIKIPKVGKFDRQTAYVNAIEIRLTSGLKYRKRHPHRPRNFYATLAGKIDIKPVDMQQLLIWVIG